ncbi:MAG: class II fructose-bisphosphate aldolase [Bacillota bacterium]
MSLRSMTELLDTVEVGYAVIAFNFIGLDDLKGVMKAVERNQTPVILQVSQGAAAHLGLDYAAALARVAANASAVPVCLHLDHATSIELILKAISSGFTSVMFDGSRLPFEQNLEMTARVVEMAHDVGVSVEAELGNIGGKEDDPQGNGDGQVLVEPSQACEFVAATGIDALAPSVGTAHGLYKGTPDIRFDLISSLVELIDVPLVLHGGSDIPDAVLQKAIRLGMRKVNVGTDLQVAHVQALREALAETSGLPDMRKVHSRVIDAVCAMAESKIRLGGLGRH